MACEEGFTTGRMRMECISATKELLGVVSVLPLGSMYQWGSLKDVRAIAPASADLQWSGRSGGMRFPLAGSVGHGYGYST